MLEVNNISKMMDIFPVINNVSFTVDDGEMISICGDPYGGDLVLQAIPGLLQVKRGYVKLDDAIIAGHGMTKKSEDYVGRFSYISTTGTLLWEKSFDYNLKFRQKWFEDYNSQRAIDALEALAPEFNRRKRASSMGEQELAVAAFALGIGMEATYFLVATIWNDIQDGTLVEKCLAMLAERKQQGCSILAVMDEAFLCGPGREHFKRILYMKMGALITDATPQTSVDKPLELLIEEWKRVAK
jgi:ABC-type branched-subunit amino acid transport system ATPase component